MKVYFTELLVEVFSAIQTDGDQTHVDLLSGKTNAIQGGKTLIHTRSAKIVYFKKRKRILFLILLQYL